MPRVNTLLLIGVLLLVALFRSSSALASAYGIAVTGTMVVTAMMAFVVIWRAWGWPLFLAAALIAPFLFIDLTFLSANLLKIVEGGWMPLALGGVVMAADTYTWRRGTRMLLTKTRKQEMPLELLVASLERKPPARVPGTAVFLTSDPNLPELRCYTVSNTIRSCTKVMSFSPSKPQIPRVWTAQNACALNQSGRHSRA